MSNNPYQSPASGALSARTPTFKLQWHHLPFIIAAICALGLMALFVIIPWQDWFSWKPQMDYFVGLGGGLGAALAYDLPVCGWLIWKWRRIRHAASTHVSLKATAE